MQESLFIGWGEADITPDNQKVELSGQYYQRLATDIHSRIKVVVLALEKGDQQALMIALDVVNFPESFQVEVREMLQEEIPELRPQNVFLNAIHTHNAPYTQATGLFRDWLPLDPDALKPADYLIFLKAQILSAAKDAWLSRSAGGIAPAFGHARVGHCRRAVYADGSAEMYGDTRRDDFVGMEAGEDSGVEMLFTFDRDGKASGMILNVACPSQVMESTYLISSDYMGATRESLKAEFGENFHTLCQISAAGCQSPRDLTRYCRHEPDFWHADGVTEIARRLTNAVRESFPQCDGQINYNPLFSHACKRVSLPMRRATFQDYRAAKIKLAQLQAKMPEYEAFLEFCKETHANEAIPKRPGPYDSKLHHFVLIQNEKAVIKRYEMQDANPNFEFDMQTLRLGNSAMINCPFELYLVFGQIIKARSAAKQTFVIQLSGGAGSYLPSPEAERLGGYGGMIINGKVGSDGGYKLADEAVEAIAKLF